MKPLLQIALDNLSLADALKTTQQVSKVVDVFEVGTILLAAEGKRAIYEIKNQVLDKIVVADGKIADAGSVFAELFFSSGADWITLICAAEKATIMQALKSAQKHHKKAVQIELVGPVDYNKVYLWKELGIKQIVYHKSRDSAAINGWNVADLKHIKHLIALGFEVTITGNIDLKDIVLFASLPIKVIIMGRSLRDDINPYNKAQQCQDEIKKHWS